jgi:hypothetical protein
LRVAVSTQRVDAHPAVGSYCHPRAGESSMAAKKKAKKKTKKKAKKKAKKK